MSFPECDYPDDFYMHLGDWNEDDDYSDEEIWWDEHRSSDPDYIPESFTEYIGDDFDDDDPETD